MVARPARGVRLSEAPVQHDSESLLWVMQCLTTIGHALSSGYPRVFVSSAGDRAGLDVLPVSRARVPDCSLAGPWLCIHAADDARLRPGDEFSRQPERLLSLRLRHRGVARSRHTRDWPTVQKAQSGMSGVTAAQCPLGRCPTSGSLSVRNAFGVAMTGCRCATCTASPTCLSSAAWWQAGWSSGGSQVRWR
jgi:hypothetical protein